MFLQVDFPIATSVCARGGATLMCSRVEATIGRYKQIIGDGLRCRKGERRVTEVGVAVHVLNHMLEPGRPISVRVA